MRSLKIAVIVMAVLIVVGLLVVIAAIVDRVSGLGTAPVAELGTVALPLPEGARITDMAVGPDKMVLLLTLANGGSELVVIELASGRVLGRLTPSSP